MKFLISSLLTLCLLSCSSNPSPDFSIEKTEDNAPEFIIPSIEVEVDKLDFNFQNSTWTQDSIPFSGYAVEKYSDNQIFQKIGIFNGKKEGRTQVWHPNGFLKSEAFYKNGKLNGTYRTWAQDPPDQLIGHLNYKNGKAHGLQKKWYSSGAIYKILRLNMGKEEGLQQAFRPNGVLYANYEARNGRIYGLKKAALCYELENEIIQ